MVFLSHTIYFCLLYVRLTKKYEQKLTSKTSMAYTVNLITKEQQVSNHLLLFHLLSCKNQCKELYLVLPKYGVIPFEIRSLKIGHTEQRRTQRFYIAEIVRHRGTVGAWRNRGYPQ